MGGLLHFVQRGGDWAGPQLLTDQCKLNPLTKIYSVSARCADHVIQVALLLQRDRAMLCVRQ